MKTWIFAAGLALSAAFTVAVPAFAQSEADFIKAFSGEWRAYDASQSDGTGQCAVTLSGTPEGGIYPAVTSHCATLLSAVTTWLIQDSQIRLLSAGNSVVAQLGGNQRRMTGGATDGSQVILERDGGDGSAAALTAARKNGPCYYLGYSQTCADHADMVKPPVVGGQAEVKVLVDLNMRVESRNDAAVVSVVKRDTCLPVTQCTVASDGVWCHAALGTSQGWVKKLSVRQSHWPIVDFANHC